MAEWLAHHEGDEGHGCHPSLYPLLMHPEKSFYLIVGVFTL